MEEITNMDKLFAIDAYSQGEESDKLFMQALQEELIFHYEHNEMYHKFCVRKGFDPYREFKLEDIPPVSVSVFKNLGGELNSVSADDIKLKLQSSATSGVPSTIVVDKMTSKRQSKAMVRVIQHYIGKHAKPFLIMDIDPRSQYRNLLGARFAAVSGYLKFANKVGYFLKADKNQISYFDVQAMKDYLTEIGDQPVVLFGFTYILYANVLKNIDESKISLKLPTGSKIIHIGGWKKLESEKISKELFNQKLADCFGIQPADIIDIYGFTEQMGLNYPDCTEGWKHTSSYSRVIVRDPITREVLPAGKEGMLEFITPVPHSYPGNVVLTDDMGIIADGNCPCGMPGTRFKVTGRMKKAEVRGCGDILSQKLTFQNRTIGGTKDNHLTVYLYSGQLHSEMPQEQLHEIITSLHEAQQWLTEQPVRAIIGLIASVTSKWINEPSLQNLKDKGLLFVSSWCDEKHLTSVASLGLRGNIDYVDKFCTFPESEKHFLKANARGLVCHWLAGNVQILGMFALVQSIIAKNVNLLRVSSRDDGVFTDMLETFRGEEYTTPDGYTIKGDDLLRTIAVVYYSRNANELGEEMSKRSDVRIAWGGAESVETIANYPSRIGTETVIFGPKLSFSVIAKESLKDEHEAKKLARRLSVDISVFDQAGCASPHNLYIEKGGKVSPQQFTDLLAEAMKKTEVQIPKPTMSIEQVSQIHSIRGVYDFKGEVQGSSSMSWTLLTEDKNELEKPVYSRVLFIHPVESIFESLDDITENIQSIGIAAPQDKAIEYAEQATSKGVARLPQIGRMLNFEMPWDGIILFDRLVRWNTLGGPLR